MRRLADAHADAVDARDRAATIAGLTGIATYFGPIDRAPPRARRRSPRAPSGRR